MIRLFFIFFSLILFIPNFIVYKGSDIILIYFYLSSSGYVYYSFRKKFIFTEIYLAALLWLGFVYKFSLVNLNLARIKEAKDYLELTPDLLDKVLLIVSYGFCLLIFLSFFREFFFSYEKLNKTIKNKSAEIIKLYFDKEKIILFLFFSFVILFSILNLKFGIFQKGIISNENVNPFFLIFFKWLTMFGFASISSFIIFSYLKYKKSFLFSMIIGVIESMITSFGFLSRASVIFNSSSFIFGYIKYANIQKKFKFKIKIILKYLLILIIAVISILYFVENKRSKLLYDNNKSKTFNISEIVEIDKDTSSNILSNVQRIFGNEFINNIVYLSLYRWVGLDSMLSVLSSQNLSKKLFFESLKEKFDPNQYSFYEKNFLDRDMKYQSHTDKNYGILVPGFFAYSIYSGSILFFLFLIFMFYSIGILIEKFAFVYSYGNFIFSALISQIYVYRLIHFGYMPFNSWKLLLAIVFNILIYYLVIKCSKKF